MAQKNNANSGRVSTSLFKNGNRFAPDSQNSLHCSKNNSLPKHQHEYECRVVLTPKSSESQQLPSPALSAGHDTRNRVFSQINQDATPESVVFDRTNPKIRIVSQPKTSNVSYGTLDSIVRPDLPDAPTPFASSSLLNPHCHPPKETQYQQSSARRKLIIASVLCLLFMAVETVGGLISGSLAILTDAAHLLSDFASFMIQIFAIWLASKQRTKSMSFGWYRAETIGALTSILVIWLVTGILVYIAIERIQRHDLEINALFMLATSGFGIVVNIIMAVALHPPHNHKHHSHKDEEILVQSSDELSREAKAKSSAGMNLNVRAALIHVIGDLVQSVGVFAAALLIYFVPGTEIADPICTFLFSVLVLLTTVTILRDILNILMEGSPRNVEFAQVQTLLSSIPGVVRIHNLRIWGLSMDKVAVNAHLVIDGSEVNSRNVLHNALRSLHSTFNNLYETTIQIEEYNSDMDDCMKCSQDDPATLVTPTVSSDRLS